MIKRNSKCASWTRRTFFGGIFIRDTIWIQTKIIFGTSQLTTNNARRNIFNKTKKEIKQYCAALSRPHLFKFFKGCLTQNVLGSLLNTLSQICLLDIKLKLAPVSPFSNYSWYVFHFCWYQQKYFSDMWNVAWQVNNFTNYHHLWERSSQPS